MWRGGGEGAADFPEQDGFFEERGGAGRGGIFFGDEEGFGVDGNYLESGAEFFSNSGGLGGERWRWGEVGLIGRGEFGGRGFCGGGCRERG